MHLFILLIDDKDFIVYTNSEVIDVNRIGERFKTNEGFIAIIVDYKNYNNVFIVFEGNEDMIPKIRMDSRRRWLIFF